MVKMHDMEERQAAIVDEFAVLAEDFELCLHHVIEQGQLLPLLAGQDQQPRHLVAGCMSKVWLLAELDAEQRMQYRAQSDAAITRGLVQLLLRVYSGQPPAAILSNELFFPSAIGMTRFIGTQRSGGFAAMVKRFKQLALQALHPRT